MRPCAPWSRLAPRALRSGIVVLATIAGSFACDARSEVPRAASQLAPEPVAEDVELVVEAPRATLRARAERARLSREGDVVRLEGDVRARATEPLTGQGTGPRGARTGRTLDLSAERLVVDSRGRVATFEEHVRLVTDGMRLECARLVVRYDARGEAETLRASGGVRVSYGEGSASSQLAELSVPRRRLVLTGEPRLHRGGVSLAADRVEIDLASGRATLARPRGTIALPSGGALP